MIVRQSGAVLLERFATDLAAQSPLALDRKGLDLSAADSASVEGARLAWAGRILEEYRSVAHFSQLLAVLARIEAPFAALCAIQRLIGDELRHTELCMEVTEWLGGTADLEIDLAEFVLPDSDDPPIGRALEIIERELVVAETESLVAIYAYRNATTDPAVKRAFDILFRDEVRHAAVGRQLSKLLRETFAPSEFGAVLDRLPETKAADRTYIRGAYLSSASDGPGRAFGGSIRPSDLEAALFLARDHAA